MTGIDYLPNTRQKPPHKLILSFYYAGSPLRVARIRIAYLQNACMDIGLENAGTP
jgi:hypothetical protein